MNRIGDVVSIEFICSHCNTTLRVQDEHAGKQARCPHCESLNAIPSNASVPVAKGESPFHPTVNAPVGAAPGPPASKNPFAPVHTTSPSGYGRQVPHRGSTVLTLGVVSLLCNFFFIPGILAWVYGRGDLKKMDAGQMDSEGRGMTLAGMILGIISTSLWGLLIIFYAILIVFVIAVEANNW